MRNKHRRLLCVLSACAALTLLMTLAGTRASALAQDSAAGQTICTLEPGETIEYPESTIIISAESEDIAKSEDIILVTTTGAGQNALHYVYRDGKRTGPYATFDQAMKAAYAGRAAKPSHSRDCAVYEPGNPPADVTPESFSSEDGKLGIKFGGKTFGPYALVFGTRVAPDGKAAYFTASDLDKAWFGCSDGRVVSFGGIPANCKFSPDGRSAAVLVQGKLSMGQIQDLSKLPPEKLQAALADQEKKFLYTIDGKSFGPFGSSFTESSFWYASTSNDLYYRDGDDVFRNGVKFLTAESFDDCGFYPAPDGKKYALFTYDKIVFSDGPAFPAALDIAAVRRQGKVFFRWIALEEKRKLVAYERAM